MKKKGFTLVELLAVIVILSLLALLTSTAITKIVNDAKKDLSATQKELIKSATETWIADNLMKLPNPGECSYLTLKDLKEYGLMDSTVLDLETNQEISDDLKIKISTALTKYGNPVRNVEVNPESIDGCSKIYSPICTLTSGTALTKGSKYTCQVNETTSYNFYVLTTPSNEATTVDLIMDRNICEDGMDCDYLWLSDEDFVAVGGVVTDEMQNDGGTCQYGGYCVNTSYGPITAMKYLQEATSSWTNLKEMKVRTLTDEAGNAYNMVQTFTTYARLPYYSEVSDYNKSLNNAYLYDNLHAECYDENGETSCDVATYIYGVHEEGMSHIYGMYGYWTFSSLSSSTNGVWYVDYSGTVSSYIADEIEFGIRPVITVPVGRIE